jgi:hypothetical protein
MLSVYILLVKIKIKINTYIYIVYNDKFDWNKFTR